MSNSNRYKYRGLMVDINYNLHLVVERGTITETRELDVNLKNIIQSALREMLNEVNIKYDEEEIDDVSAKILKLQFNKPGAPFKYSYLGTIMVWINNQMEFHLHENTALSGFGENKLEYGSIMYMTMMFDLERILKFAILNQRSRILSVYSTISERSFEIELPDIKYKYSPNFLITDENGDLVITDEFQNVEIIRNKE